ncbi:MAG: hypothetical protein WCX63_05545 [Methanoregula sp.]
MVNSDGQLYTIEGFAAALIMLISAYLVVNATSIYTPGDTHISDMQLEVMGSDALHMMNTAPNGTTESPLQSIVENDDGIEFGALFNSTVNNRTGPDKDHIQFMANVSYVRLTDQSVNSSPLYLSRPLHGDEHAVHVSEWMIVNKKYPDDIKRNRTVLVEVFLWRD